MDSISLPLFSSRIGLDSFLTSQLERATHNQMATNESASISVWFGKNNSKPITTRDILAGKSNRLDSYIPDGLISLEGAKILYASPDG